MARCHGAHGDPGALCYIYGIPSRESGTGYFTNLYVFSLFLHGFRRFSLLLRGFRDVFPCFYVVFSNLQHFSSISAVIYKDLPQFKRFSPPPVHEPFTNRSRTVHEHVHEHPNTVHHGRS